MRERLYQNDHVRILLSPAIGGNDCWWTDNDQRASFNALNDACIRCGKHDDPEAIRFRVQVRISALEPAGDPTLTEAHCCLQHAQSLLNDVFSEHNTALDDYDEVYYSTQHLRTTGDCLWCGDPVHQQHGYYSLRNEAVVVHDHCADALGDVLEQDLNSAINEHADKLLTDVL